MKGKFKEEFMIKEITNIKVFQSSKVLSVLACILSALYSIPLGIYSLIEGDNDVALLLFLQPLVHLIGSFIISVLFFFFYNLIAKAVGGITFSVNESNRSD